MIYREIMRERERTVGVNTREHNILNAIID